MTITLSKPLVKSVSLLNLPKVTIPTLDLVKMELKDSSTKYRNNLVNALHGLDTVRALDLSGADPAQYEHLLMKYQNRQKGHLDGCSGSRKKGIVFSSTAPTGEGVIERYFSGSKRVTHGSIAFSECRAMFSLAGVTYQVSTDNTPGLGDCHGMIAQSLYNQLQELYSIKPNACIQFRFGVKDKWLAKGTVLPYPDSYLPDGVALLLPASCFKGACPELHVSQVDDAVFGILHISKIGAYKTSHQVLQCFTSKESQQYLLAQAEQAMTSLMASRDNTTVFAQAMLDALPDDSENTMPLVQCLAKDEHYQLHSHPTVCRTLNSLFRKRVVEIATGKFLKATGLMANPLTNLKPGYVISNALPTGEYLMFRYPVRHYGDIKLVKVVNPSQCIDTDGHVVDPRRKLIAALAGGLSKLDQHKEYFVHQSWYGTFAINPDYALEVGMDFDGDQVAFMSAAEHPVLAKEVKSWKPLPAIAKPEKKPHGKSLIEVMADSMRNSVQFLASMMTKCRFFGMVSEYAYLGEQIQLVVDSLKSDTGVDQAYIDKLGKELNTKAKAEIEAGRIPWFSIYKDRHIFLNTDRIPVIHPDHNHDTISLLFNLVGTMFDGEGTPFKPAKNEHYRFLFDEVVVQDSTLKKCEQYYYEYSKTVKSIIDQFPPDDVRSRAQELAMTQLIRYVIDDWVAWSDELKTRLTPGQLLEITAGFWKLLHATRRAEYNPSAGIIFRMFPEYIQQRLEVFRGNSFRMMLGDHTNIYDNSPVVGVIARFDNDYYFYIKDGSDDGSYAYFSQVIAHRLTAYTCIPKEYTEFPCLLSTRYNKQNQPSYIEAVIL